MAYAIQKTTATASSPSISWRQDAYLDPPVLSGPADGAAYCPPFAPLSGVVVGIRLDWQAVTGAVVYVVQLSQGDQSFQGPLSQGIRTTNTYLDLRYLTHIRVNQPIFWRVFAYTYVGGASVASEVRKVTLACPEFDSQGRPAEGSGGVLPFSCDSLGAALDIQGETTLGFGDTGRYTVDISYDCEHYEGSDVDVTSVTWSTKVPDGHRIFTNTPIDAAKSANYYDVAVEQGPVPYAFSITCEVVFTAVKSGVTTGTATCSKTINVTVGGRAADQDLIWVRNDFAFVLPEYAPVGIDMVIPSDNITEDRYDEGLYEKYNHRHVYSCTRPEPRHIGRWAVLQHQLKPGEVGQAVISGRTTVRAPALTLGYKVQYAWDLSVNNPFHSSISEVFPDIDFEYVVTPYAGDITSSNAAQQWWRAWLSTSHCVALANTKGSGAENQVYSTNEWGINWPSKASLLDRRVTYYADGGCEGYATFTCENSKFVETENTCQEACGAWFYPEQAAYYYLATGDPDAYGMGLPCTEGTEVRVPCFPEPSTGELVLSREVEYPRIATCEMSRICTHECQDTGGGVYDWVQTMPCAELSNGNPCHCPTLDSAIWPCSEYTEPRLVVSSCRTLTTTTTTTGDPTTTTSDPPCTGTCTGRCTLVSFNPYTGAPVSPPSFQWILNDSTCTGGPSSGGQACICPLGSVAYPCGPGNCGEETTVNCDVLTWPTTTTAAPSTTSGTGDPNVCTNQATFVCRCSLSGTGKTCRWQYKDLFSFCTVAGNCCDFPGCPSGTCDEAHEGDEESVACHVSPQPCEPPTTTSSTTTTGGPSTTTSAPPCGDCVFLYMVPPSAWSEIDNRCSGTCICTAPESAGVAGQTAVVSCVEPTTTAPPSSTTTVAPTTTTVTGSSSSPPTTTSGTSTSGSSSSPPTTTTTADPCTSAVCMWGCQDPGGGYQWVQSTVCPSPCSCAEPALPCFDGSSPSTAETSCET